MLTPLGSEDADAGWQAVTGLVGFAAGESAIEHCKDGAGDLLRVRRCLAGPPPKALLDCCEKRLSVLIAARLHLRAPAFVVGSAQQERQLCAELHGLGQGGPSRGACKVLRKASIARLRCFQPSSSIDS